MSQIVDRRSLAVRASTVAPTSQQVGPWQLVQLVSSGPTCDVYQARPLAGGANAPASYALKLLRPEWQAHEHAVAMIQREAVVGSRVSHRHLLPVLAAQVERAPFFVVTPWIDGVTLDHYLDTESGLPLATSLWILRQAAEALLALHRAGWLHGDIKPANLLISPGWHVTLLDLGFARQQGEAGSAATRFGLGTPHYLAPEAVTSQLATDIRSEIFSLGALFYHLVTGRPPFEGNSLEALLTAHRSQTPAPVRSFCPTLPHDVAELVHSMLAKEPLRRPQTPTELIARLIRLEIDALAERF